MSGFDVIDSRYQAIHARAVRVLMSDSRVKDLKVVGSVGADSADQWSDLDLAVVATDDGFDSLLADWPSWLAEITPTAFARTPIAPSVINAVTLDGLTLDVVVHPGSIFEFPASSTWQVGMMGGRFDNLNDALEHAVVEQFRGLCGPFISLVQRDEHLRHLAGVPHLLGLLTTVFLSEMNAPMPGKFWNETFTIEQRNAVARLPAVAADRTALIAFGLALAELLVSRARPEFIRRGIAWPAPFAAVVAARLHEQLDLDCTEWLR